MTSLHVYVESKLLVARSVEWQSLRSEQVIYMKCSLIISGIRNRLLSPLFNAFRSTLLFMIIHYQAIEATNKKKHGWKLLGRWERTVSRSNETLNSLKQISPFSLNYFKYFVKKFIFTYWQIYDHVLTTVIICTVLKLVEFLGLS